MRAGDDRDPDRVQVEGHPEQVALGVLTRVDLDLERRERRSCVLQLLEQRDGGHHQGDEAEDGQAEQQADAVGPEDHGEPTATTVRTTSRTIVERDQLLARRLLARGDQLAAASTRWRGGWTGRARCRRRCSRRASTRSSWTQPQRGDHHGQRHPQGLALVAQDHLEERRPGAEWWPRGPRGARSCRSWEDLSRRSADRTRSQKPTQPTAMPRKMPTRANAGEVSRRAVDQQADDQPADDGTDQEPAEPDEVAAP